MATNTIISLRPRNLIRQLPWQLDTKMAGSLLLLLGCLTIVGVIYLSQASAVTATTYHIDALRMELEQLQNQNAALVLEIAQLEALSRVEERAAGLGFQAVTEVKYLKVEGYPVEPQNDIATYQAKLPVRGNVDEYMVNEDDTVWWVNLLDNVTAQIER